jgi:hypothetical protein
MATDAELRELAAQAEKESFVTIRFPEPDKAEFIIYKQNVTPAQVLGAIAILELQVKNWWVQTENQRLEQERQQQLSVPKPSILRA